ncbi:MAG TPA: hypothetical protein VJ761_21575 [Ktedonobacteraceae bacterium]|nr:hypothetical protein [Ktedonobacteraceae bacterium]
MQPPSQDPTNPTGQWYQQSPVSSPQGNYPPGEEAHYKQFTQGGGTMTQYPGGNQGKLTVPPIPPKPRNGWKVVSFVLLILVIILAATTTLVLTRLSNSTGQGPTPVATQPVPTSTSVPTQPVPTSTSGATQAVQPTPTTSTSNNYSAPQPGPGCDTNGGTWTPQGFSNITCGTQAIPASTGIWGYLYLQLPNNMAFSANNKITITASNFAYGDCIGLAEQDANAGFLASYCQDGTWSIDSISNKGTIVQTLSRSVTSTRTTTTISLALKGNTLLFTVDTESHQITVSPIQLNKVAIGFDSPSCGNCSVTATNFSYITPAN